MNNAHNPKIVARDKSEWTEAKRREFDDSFNNGCVGSELVSESDKVRVWSIRLAPGERLPFHRHVLDYFWTAITSGKARSHVDDGTIVEVEYDAGDTSHQHYGEGEYKIHDLENIGDSELIFTTVEFLDSANSALAVPKSVRRQAA